MDSNSLPRCDRPAEAHTNNLSNMKMTQVHTDNLCNVRMTPQAQLSIYRDTKKGTLSMFQGSELLGFKQGTTFQQAICKTQHEQGCQSGF